MSRLDLVLASLLTVVTIVKIQNDDLDHQQQTSAGVTNPFDSMTTIILKEELCKLVNAESRKNNFYFNAEENISKSFDFDTLCAVGTQSGWLM